MAKNYNDPFGIDDIFTELQDHSCNCLTKPGKYMVKYLGNTERVITSKRTSFFLKYKVVGGSEDGKTVEDTITVNYETPDTLDYAKKRAVYVCLSCGCTKEEIKQEAANRKDVIELVRELLYLADYKQMKVTCGNDKTNRFRVLSYEVKEIK